MQLITNTNEKFLSLLAMSLSLCHYVTFSFKLQRQLLCYILHIQFFILCKTTVISAFESQ